MKSKSTQSGVTLTEMTVVIAAVAVLTCLGLPAIHTLFNSFESSGSTEAMIGAALASARAIAAKEQHYAGIRFQKAYHLEGPLEAPQYMIFIVQDPEIMAYGFRAVEGTQPIKLPDSIGVMDLRYRTNADPKYSGDELIDKDDDINVLERVKDTTAFSIIFSPSGKLVIHDVRVRNRDGEGDSASYTDLSNDDVFNKKAKVDAGIAMFYQDDYAAEGFGQEVSRNSFIIYERDKFRQAYLDKQPYSGYLVQLALDADAIYINPYTGTIIKR